MQKYLLLIVTVYLMSCSSGKYLQQCQVDGVETLGKGMSAIGNKFPEAYTRVNKYLFENRLMTKLGEIGSDSNYNHVAEQIKTLSQELALDEARDQKALNEQSTSWILCLKISELLKALANPELTKIFSEKKEEFMIGVDSLVSKYNYSARKPIKAPHGTLFSEIAFKIGKHKFKKTQKKYFKMAVDSAAPIMDTMLSILHEVQLRNYNQDIKSAENSYFQSYIILNEIQAEEKKMTPALAQKMLTELETVRKEIIYLQLLGKILNESAGDLRKLIAALQKSTSDQINCDTINTLITSIDSKINAIDTYSSFLK